MKNKTTMIALMATSILLAGCGGGGGNTAGGESGGKFTLQIFAGGYGTSAWEYALKLFEKDHPEYDISANMDNNVNEQFANRWKHGNPCILNLYHSDPRIQSPFLECLMGGLPRSRVLRYNVGAVECVPIRIRL